MIKTNLNCGGCLSIFILFFILMFLLKHWVVVLLVFVVLPYLYKKLVLETSLVDKIKKQFSQNKEFKGKTGQVYKYCSFCNTKSERTAIKCSVCEKPFE